MQLGIVLAALRKHRMATFLIAIEIALACSVMGNAIFLVVERTRTLNLDSGVDESSLGVVQLAGFDSENAVDINARMIDSLRRIPGVQEVGVISGVPFGKSAVRAGVHLDEDLQRFGGVLDFYIGDSAAIRSLGLRVISGRLPSDEEYAPILQYVPPNASVLVTKELADEYWPGESAVGKSIWAIETQFRVIGVVEHLSVSEPGGGEAKGADWSLVIPAVPGAQLAGKYLLRGNPTDLPRVMRDAREAVSRVAPDVVFDEEGSRSLVELRESYFKSARLMRGLIFGVIIALLGTTALGIVGLTSYWVEQRRKQIGIRRALGATKSDILRYFQMENFLIVTLGIVVGMMMAYGMNLVMMRYYELPRLPLMYLPLSAAVLWLLGQCAVLVPAMRASSIAPASAIRSF